MKRTRTQAALALKALGEPRRIEILQLLRKGPRAVGEIAAEVDVSQQAVSQHLAVLDRAGLVEARKEGTRSVYAVRPAGFAPVEEFVRAFWQPRLAALKEEIENEKKNRPPSAAREVREPQSAAERLESPGGMGGRSPIHRK